MTTPRSRQSDSASQRRIVDAWIGSQRSPNTKAAYRADFKTFAEWCASAGTVPLRAGSDTVLAFTTARRAAGDSTATLRRRWSSLSSFFDFAIDHKAARVNPLTGITRQAASTGNPSPTGQLTAQAVAGYRELAASIDPRLDALVALLVADGLKLGEALALDVDDVKGRPPKTTLTVRRRGNNTRITLDAASAAAIVRCIGTRRQGPVFLSSAPSPTSTRRLTRFGADHLIRQLSRGDEPRVTTNELRRFHITNSHLTETDLNNVRDRAGLSSVRSVQRYLIIKADHDLE